MSRDQLKKGFQPYVQTLKFEACSIDIHVRFEKLSKTCPQMEIMQI